MPRDNVVIVESVAAVIEEQVTDPILLELLAEHLKDWMYARGWYFYSILHAKSLKNHPDYRYYVYVSCLVIPRESAHLMKITANGSIYS